MSKDIPVEEGSGNIFEDLGFSDEEAKEELLKAQLGAEIFGILEKRGLTQTEAAKILGVKQPEVSRLKSGKSSPIAAMPRRARSGTATRSSNQCQVGRLGAAISRHSSRLEARPPLASGGSGRASPRLLLGRGDHAGRRPRLVVAR